MQKTANVSPLGLANVLHHMWLRCKVFRVLSCDRQFVNIGNGDGVQMRLPSSLAKQLPTGAEITAYNQPWNGEMGLISDFDGKPRFVPLVKIA